MGAARGAGVVRVESQHEIRPVRCSDRAWFSAAVCGLLAGLIGCELPPSVDIHQPVAAYRARMIESAAARSNRDAVAPGRLAASVEAAGLASNRAALLVQPQVEEPPSPEAILAEIPDPSEAERVFAERLEAIRQSSAEPRVVRDYDRVIALAREYLTQLHIDRRRELGLAECIQRALENSFAIRIESYNPAISQTNLVEAEAAFDAAFFLDSSYDKRDTPTATDLQATSSDTRQIAGGIRKLLPTGMRVQASVQQTRQFADFQFQQLNPAYTTAFVTQFTQPLLRGFGLDYNRAAINIARADQRIAEEAFIQQVRETLVNVERAYWQLAQARRSVMIQAETVAQNAVTYENILSRGEHDATIVQINNALARWKQREVAFQEAVRQVREAEDVLKNLMNDPEFRMSETIEILPTETYFAAPLAIDQFSEVRTAIDRRSEIRQTKHRIDQARIRTQVAKNETLPQLDLSFTYEVDGLAGGADTSFDKMTTARFQSYAVSATFSYPIGNRGPEAAYRRARLEESQAIVALNQITDRVVQEVNTAVRELIVRYINIVPQLDSVHAANRNLRALQARAQSIDPPFLETELNAVDQLNNTRSVLLQILTDYNVAIVQLENAKGTLLEYNNVRLADERAGR